MPKGQRLDQLIIERGILPSREIARTAIMDGAVLVNGQKMTKPGMNVSESAVVELIPGFSQPKFVSRGGLKLEKGLDFFQIEVSNRIALDIGASTGGFTDCLLKRGASKVYAVDVGYGQLDWALRSDARVIVRERINARNLKASDLYAQDQSDQHQSDQHQSDQHQLDQHLSDQPESDQRQSDQHQSDQHRSENHQSDDHYNGLRASLVVMDVSFISITKILPVIADVTAFDDRLDVVCLVKPQFEAGKNAVGKGGIVKSAETHIQVLNYINDFAESIGLHAVNFTFSPVKGPAGNIEFLTHLKKGHSKTEFEFEKLVATANSEL